MNSYLLIILSDILLTVDFACKKVYQKKAGIGAYAGISFNSVSGFVLTITFWAVNGFTIGFSYYSFIMAAVMTVLSSAYTIIGFRVLKIGGMSFYTLFLMTGGMIVPYIWGVLFLNEQSNLMKAIGIILIILAIFISNTSGSKIDKKLSIFCVAVFFLNGFVSIFSKMHQVNTAYERVDATEFIFWIGIMRFIICGMVLQFVKRQNVNVEKIVVFK